jgi:hypothetical protein
VVDGRAASREARIRLRTDLNLAAMKVDDQHAMSAHSFDHSGDGGGRDRYARLGLAVLTRVAVVRHHCCDALRRRQLQRLQQQQQLHHVIVDVGRTRRLYHKHIRSANVVVDLYFDFACTTNKKYTNTKNTNRIR